MYRSVVLSDPAYAAIDQRRFRFSKGSGWPSDKPRTSAPGAIG